MQSVKSEDVPDDQSSPFASSSTAVSAEPPLARSSPGASSSGSRSTKDDIDEQETLIEGFKCLNMNLKHAHFLGKSSSLIFVHAATAALKQEFTRDGGGDIEIPPDAGKAIEQENSIGKVFEREAVRHRECWETMTVRATHSRRLCADDRWLPRRTCSRTRRTPRTRSRRRSSWRRSSRTSSRT